LEALNPNLLFPNPSLEVPGMNLLFPNLGLEVPNPNDASIAGELFTPVLPQDKPQKDAEKDGQHQRRTEGSQSVSSVVKEQLPENRRLRR
jgi:hypothetical protein